MNETETWPHSASLEFLEELFAAYCQDPRSVPDDWRPYFDTLSAKGEREIQRGPSFRPGTLFDPAPAAPKNGNGNGHGHAPALAAPAKTPGAVKRERDLNVAAMQDRVDQLVRAYRVRGHMAAQLDPLGRPRSSQPELDPEHYGFTEGDLDRTFSTRTIGGPDTLTLRGIVERLRNTYCRRIGVQFMHIDDVRVRTWLQERMESSQNRLTLTRPEQLRILTKLTDATVFEEFIHKRFQGSKSFSLEGAESLIPLLDLAIERSGEQGIAEIVLGMAHRGRLNVLANILGKSPQQIFREFADIDPELHLGHGDVKYHLGYSNDWVTTAGAKVHLSLCFNPSHLEFVNPVVQGRVRAKQDRFGDLLRERAMGIIIHGDAAFAGEGVVQESLNLSQLAGYATGGTLHIVVNNQIGFTTNPHEARSCTYATDPAKMLQIPIFHVNGEDPESVAQVVRLAMDFRRAFGRDVVIDMYCYRLFGHNEQDEPEFTQPRMYQAIHARKSVRDGYLEHLLQLGGVTQEEAERISHQRRELLEQELNVARSDKFVHRADGLQGLWKGYRGGPESQTPDVDTGLPVDQLSDLLLRQLDLPADFHPHGRLEKMFLHARREMAQGARPLDWSAAESLAFASLVTTGTRVRLSGQDSGRGTFSHRHCVLHDSTDGHTFIPLANLSVDQAPFEVYNSPLSEIAVMGFDYGYSLDCPDGLVLWEAQFGDFANVAQVIIDQFIVSAEDKWKRLSGLVLLLPHGFEGQGPEHSSARLERFLTLAAEDNIQVCCPTTPAQYFHLLRRQVLRPWRKPLVVMTPKWLLRYNQAVSTLEELSTGTYRRVLPDIDPYRMDVERVLLCSGKVYYELYQERERLERHRVSIVRLEQLYPLPTDELQETLARVGDGVPVVWVQDEPENMGAWRYLRVHWGERLFGRLPFSGVYRPASASPATGSHSSHKLEQSRLLASAFGVD